MNPEVKQDWLNVLRSDDYQQTTGRLRDDHGYCCLGVLCDLYIKSTNKSIGWEKDPRNPGSYLYMDNSSVLPADVAVWAGLEDDNPHTLLSRLSGDVTKRLVDLDIVDPDVYLSDVNDSGLNFKEVADIIEQGF